VHAKAMEDDPRQRQPDIGKARRLLGWEPRVALEDGLVPTVRYFRERIDAGTKGRSSRA
jgi:UDP-glucuronate decarboxylase